MSISKTSSMDYTATGMPSRQTVRTPFGDIAYLEAGEGPAAVFIHGVFLNAGLWQHQLAGLADLRRCIAVDLLAHGQSPCPPSGRELTLSMQAEMVLALLDALGIDSADLVGNDSGGSVVQLIVARAPQRVRTLTLTNCEAHDNFPPAAFASVHQMAREGSLAAVLPVLAADPDLARAAMASGLEHPERLSD